ncbi:efflux ABC permease, putative [Babesia ovata]|uniref:Efflux ABC permease, putative n=1 Tax=Babesia ovata TaxID=189622 RepID=A0A2H6KCL4_9APIC|nr:efflux ABC permease, putative [Babesia ovata]GBE60740.1 efflux ABC permease, putative [Babesia ovata]
MLRPSVLTWLCIVASFLEGYALSYGVGQLVSVAFLRSCSGIIVNKSCCEAIADAQCFCKQKADYFQCQARYDTSKAESPCGEQKPASTATNHIIWVLQNCNANNTGNCFPLKCKCKKDGVSSPVKEPKFSCTMCKEGKSETCKTSELVPVVCTKKVVTVEKKDTTAAKEKQIDAGSGDSTGGKGGSTSEKADSPKPEPGSANKGSSSPSQQQNSTPQCPMPQEKGKGGSQGTVQAETEKTKAKADAQGNVGEKEQVKADQGEQECKDGEKDNEKEEESKCFCKNVVGMDCTETCKDCSCAKKEKEKKEKTKKRKEKEKEGKEEGAGKEKNVVNKMRCIEWITTNNAQHYLLRNAQSSTCDDCDLTLWLEGVPVGNRGDMCCVSVVNEPPFTCCWQKWNPDADRLYIGYMDANCPLCSIVEVRQMDFAKEFSHHLKESFPHHFNIRNIKFGSCCHSTFYLKLSCDKRDKYPHLHRRKYNFKDHPISYIYFTTAAVMDEELEKLAEKREQAKTASAAASTGSSGVSSSSGVSGKGAPSGPLGAGGKGTLGGGGQAAAAAAAPVPQKPGQSPTQPSDSAPQPAPDPAKTCDDNGNLVLSPSTEFLVDQKYKKCCFGVATRIFTYYRYVTEMLGCRYCVKEKCDESNRPIHCDCTGGKCSIGCCVKVPFTDEISTQKAANEYRYLLMVGFWVLCLFIHYILMHLFRFYTSPSSVVYCDFGVRLESITTGGWKDTITEQLADPNSEVYSVKYYDTEEGMESIVNAMELFIPGKTDTFAKWVKAQVATVLPEYVQVTDMSKFYTACVAMCLNAIAQCFEIVTPIIRRHLQRWEMRWEKEYACYKESLVSAIGKSAHMSRLAQVMRYEMDSFMYNAVPDLPDSVWATLVNEIKMYQWIAEHEQKLLRKRRSGDYDSQLTIKQVFDRVWRKRMRLIEKLVEEGRVVFHWDGLISSYKALQKYYARRDLAFGITEEPPLVIGDSPADDFHPVDATPHTDAATPSQAEAN